MQSPLLSGSFLKTQSLPPPKTVHSSLFSLNGTPKKRQSVKLLKKNSGFRLCSVSGKWTDPQFGNSEGAGLQDSPGMVLPFCNSKSLKGNIQRFRDLNNCGFSRALSTKDLDTANIPLSHLPYGRLWKFLMLMGLFTLQGSQQALAGLDLPTGLQSIPILGDPGDISTGFASVRRPPYNFIFVSMAFLLIFFSELGDKTFFIAALLAARNSAAVVFLGTFGALASMTIISVALGRTFHYVDEALPFRIGDADLPVDDIAAVCLLVYFGVSTLIEASSDDGTKGEEEQKEAELAVSEFSGNGAGILAAASTVISTFLLVFVAEWGDKSFFSTIALAAASSPLGVIGGAIAGHGVATLLAVLGGSLLGTFLSEKVIAYIGGSLFLVFAVVTLIEIVT